MNRNTLSGLAAILLWSSTIALARSLSETVGARTSGCAVYLTGGLLLLFLSKAVSGNRGHRLEKRPSMKYFLVCGGLFVLYTWCLFSALGRAMDRQQALEAGLVNYLWPSLTVLLSVLLITRKASVILGPALVISFSGIVLVMTDGKSLSWSSFLLNLEKNPSAYALAFIAAISWALYSTLSKKWGDAEAESTVPYFLTLTGLVFGMSVIFLPEHGSMTCKSVFEITALGTVTGLGYVFWDIGVRKGDHVIVILGSYFTPLLSTAISCMYLGILPGIKLWTGCLLIISGALLSWYSIRKSQDAFH